jgi:hypothetical protein
MKRQLKKIELGNEEFELIGCTRYCIYCGREVEVEDEWCDRELYTTYKCDCSGANEAARIRERQEKLKNRLIQLKTKQEVKKRLNYLKFKAAIRAAASEFEQPIPPLS